MIADIVLGILLLSFLFAGLRRGFVKLVAFACCVVACAAGVVLFQRPLYAFIARSFREDYAGTLSYTTIFTAGAIVFWLASNAARRKLEKGGLGGVDTLLGGILAAATWAALAFLFVLHADRREGSIADRVLQGSYLRPYLRIGARETLDRLPPDYRRKIEGKPPAAPAPSPGPAQEPTADR